MLKGRGQDTNMRRSGVGSPQNTTRPAMAGQQRALPAKPEPDYEVVEFPSDQYVNAKLQPPPPPPPRPPTGHPVQAGASCGLCGGGGARVRCSECGRRALCASCDDMYHRHPKRRHHQRQALSPSQLGEDRPPLPPKGTPPVPPPRRHKLSASPMPPMTPLLDQRRTINHGQPTMIGAHPHTTMLGSRASASPIQHQTQPLLVQTKMVNNPAQMPFLPKTMPHQQMHMQHNASTLGHLNAGWNRPRGSLQGFNVPQVQEPWESSEIIPSSGMAQGQPQWGRPMRRGASTLELGGGNACPGCAHCGPQPWRYGSCAALDQPWVSPGWPVQQFYPPQSPHGNFHMHPHMTPQPHRRADSRTMSRTASRTGSRAASPALSVRSRASRRNKHRSPSPPLPSSDADSESESEPIPKRNERTHSRSEHPNAIERSRTEPSSRSRPSSPAESLGAARKRSDRTNSGSEHPNFIERSRTDLLESQSRPISPVESLVPPSAPWQCEHCTYVNEAGVRVCVICCKTPTQAPRVITTLTASVERMTVANRSASPVAETIEAPREDEIPSSKSKKERTSTGCGPSPPREDKSKKTTQRLATPTREQNGSSAVRQTHHNTAVGPSPPKETIRNESDARNSSVGALSTKTVERHSISVGPSPPRERTELSTGQKKFVGTSPPRDVRPESSSSIASKTNVSNTGTSPPPQNISTQTYEDPSIFERAPSAARSRPRRRFRDDTRERSRSRHSLSSDTRESDRSIQTSGAWEWRERDSSPSVGGEWRGKLARRASHLDLRRRDVARRTSLYGSEAPSPEPPPSGGRAISMEVLSGAGRNTERGLELARLLAEAERLGYSAAEVQVGLSQSPGAPLSWLRSRWAGLVGAVQGAAARLAPGLALSEEQARAALARHRGAVWPAVTECVDAIRHKTEKERVAVSSEGRLRGRVWGSPAGAEVEGAPRARAEDSSDEFEYMPTHYLEDEWAMDADYEVDREIDLWRVPPVDPISYDPPRLEQEPFDLSTPNRKPVETSLFDGKPEISGLDPNPGEPQRLQPNLIEHVRLDPKPETQAVVPQLVDPPSLNALTRDTAKVALKLRSLLLEAGIPAIDENLLLKGLLNTIPTEPEQNKPSLDIQSENDFIDAYNALTRASPLPNINKNEIQTNHIETNSKPITKDDENKQSIGVKIINNVSHHHHKLKHHPTKQINGNANHIIEANQMNTHKVHVTEETLNNKNHLSNNEKNHVTSETRQVLQPNLNQSNGNDLFRSTLEKNRQTEDRPSNLNDIVDNTQRLIQQMKEEINSDIHSLGDGHSQTSRSDHDSSSHDEQESSYSETDEETNNSMTSNEKEITSSEDEHIENYGALKNGASINRTSSEDNEQFEEALDHLDNQIEDVKHANIEMLDSIARSLQEEHTITLERNEPNEKLHTNHSRARLIEKNNSQDIDDSQNISLIVDPIKPNNIKKKDPNNNRFVAVNSFEEIYEELDTSNSMITSQPQINKPVDIMSSNIQKETEVIVNVPTEPINMFSKYPITETILKIVSPTRVMILDYKEPSYNAVIENTEENSTIETNGVDTDVHENIDYDNANQLVNVDIQEIYETEHVKDLNDTSPETVINNIVKATEALSTVIQEDPIRDPIPKEEEDSQINVKNQTKTDTQNTKNYKDVQPSQNEIMKRDTPEKASANSTKEINRNKSSPTKSNIPKPVRTSAINKPKNEKSTPKLLVSKVPVRRGSLKQYHAPTPPKTHFGNVHSGHVKQLQSKIFNSKDTKPVKPQETEIEVTPSTSTGTLKKGQAPQPPRRSEPNSSPPKTSPPIEKKNRFFRETCRTEDEWTDSDSDESQIIRQTSVEEVKQPSPPPPITLRRVSGNLIDLARVRLPEGSPERQARMLLAEGATETWEQAHLAVELVSRGTELPTALLAALECADLSAALAYLHQDCELCASRLPEHEMVSMLRCTHRCCRECARLYFTVQVTERSIADCVCPYCKVPELEGLPEDAWLEYFAHLDIQLKTLVETDVHELFQRKLRDRTLAMDPNFRWCMECSSGFFVHPKQKKLRCPECRSVSCASCRKSWSANHEGLTCEQFAAWLADNDPEISVAAVQQHLRENGLECPRCHFKYSLSRGGCMHFTCTQCKYEFCYGCGKPFTMGARCGLSEYCAKLGLHAHHPRNCLFYLRDKEPHELQTLLQMNNVTYETEATEGSNGRCPIPLQRETPTGLVDGICGSEVPLKSAGLCKNHYLEYLTRLVRARGADPLPILGVDDLETLVRRAGLRLPPRPYGSLEGIYRRSLTEIVKEKIPLD